MNKNKYIILSLSILSLPVFAFVIYFTIMEIRSTSRKMEEISAKFNLPKDRKTKLAENIAKDSLYLTLLREKAYLQARVKMAESDSVYLTFNLTDSVVNIEIKGVVVNSTPIDEIEISKILTTGDQYFISNLLSEPLNIIKDTASIEKIPYIRKIAPKDSSEFKPDAVPDTAFYQPVNYIFETDKGIKLIVYQSEERKQGDSKNQFMFDLRHRLANFKAAMKDIKHFKVPEYQLYIKIKVPSADAKIIYRAVPMYGQIGIHL
jgi:hypothetical protein